MKLWTWSIVAFAILLAVTCKEDGPTAPSATPAPPGISVAPGQQANPNEVTPPEPATATATIWTNGESVYTKIENNRGKAENFVFVCYQDPTGEIGDQIMLEPYHQINLEGHRATGRLGLKVPENADGDMCAVQCDTVERRTPRAIPYYTAAELLTYAHYGEGACQIEPQCEGDCTDECVKTPNPSGPGLECEWIPSICNWGCKCVPTTKPECPEMIWNYESCSWVGLCFCEPVGEPDCPEQTWDSIKCAWVGDCECEPVGEPECPEQTWNEKTCKWEGPCECDPVGEPECQEQTWNPKTCKWEGDCPCEVEICDLGYVWNQDKCQCEAGPICHVSNKGGDADWNIKEQNLKFSPGHAGHLDINSFCPPDYLAECDGRYDNQPNMCR